MLNNIFKNLPANTKEEIFEDLLNHNNIKIERIISSGQTTPEESPYIQDQAEWVIVLKGKADVIFCDSGKEHNLTEGDYLFIPAKCSHRVTYTADETIWLAIHIF